MPSLPDVSGARDLASVPSWESPRGVHSRADTRQPVASPWTQATPALDAASLDRLLAQIPRDSHAGRRDRALLLVAVATALPHSALLRLIAEDICIEGEGARILIPPPATDRIELPKELLIRRGSRPSLCAVQALQAWLLGAEIDGGPVFRRVRAGDRVTEDRLTPHSVALIVKTWAIPVRVDPRVFASRRLRRSGIAKAIRRGTDYEELVREARLTEDPVLSGGQYRRASAFDVTAQVLASRAARGAAARVRST